MGVNSFRRVVMLAFVIVCIVSLWSTMAFGENLVNEQKLGVFDNNKIIDLIDNNSELINYQGTYKIWPWDTWLLTDDTYAKTISSINSDQIFVQFYSSDYNDGFADIYVDGKLVCEYDTHEKGHNYITIKGLPKTKHEVTVMPKVGHLHLGWIGFGDKTSPETAAPSSQLHITPALINGFGNGDTKVSITAMDNTDDGKVASGIAKIEYSVDNGPWINYIDPFTLPEGTHVIKYHSIDRNGNIENDKSESLTIDRTGPIIQSCIEEKTFIYNASIKVNYSVLDNLSGVASIHAVYNGKPVKNGENITLNNLGENILTITATDNVGNQSTLTKKLNVTYRLLWLPPFVNKSPYKMINGSTLPVKFTLVDFYGRFVKDNSIKLLIKDNTNIMVNNFIVGKSENNLRLNNNFYSLIFKTKGLNLKKDIPYNLIVVSGDKELELGRKELILIKCDNDKDKEENCKENEKTDNDKDNQECKESKNSNRS